MANPEHVALLRQGTPIWNEWRARNPDSRPDLRTANLSGANLVGKNLHRADLSGANLSGANLSRANLSGANLHMADLSGAVLYRTDLSEAKLIDANLRTADLRTAHLRGANLSGANLQTADLSETVLSKANFSEANLSGANLSGADLVLANLSGAKLNGANLRGANCGEANLSHATLLNTIFANVNLGKTNGLDECVHLGPSVIDFQTLSLSGNLPLSFLRGCGLPDMFVDYLPSLRADPIQFYSCFISYSSKDQVFVEGLRADLQNKGVRCWFAPHDLPIGAKTWDAIDEAIRLRDKLLVVLSKASIGSDWVEDEVNRAYAEERSRQEVVLFPIRIDNEVMSTAEPWAVKLRDQRNIGDFRGWTQPAEYQESFERLLRDLKTTGSK